MTSEPNRSGWLPRWFKWTIILVPTVAVFIVLPLLVMFWDDLHSWERRFPFPANQPLTEDVALDYSRRAFARTWIDMTGAQPLPFYSTQTNILIFDAENTNRGSLVWRVPSQGTQRRAHYSAYVEKKGPELVVTLSEHWK